MSMMSETSQAQLHSLLSQVNGLIQQNRLTKARKVCEQAIALAPDCADAYMLLAGVYEGRGAVVDAINAYRKAIECDENHLASWVNLGVCQKERGHLGAAVDAFTHAVEADPSSLQARYNLARALFDDLRYREAIEQFLAVLKQRPGWAEVRFNVGLAFAALEDFPNAIEVYKKTIEMKPDYAEAYSQLAVCWIAEAEFELANEYLEKALQIDPDDSVALLLRAKSSLSGGESERYLAHIKNLLAKHDLSRDGYVRLNYAAFNLLHKRAEHDDAFDHVSRANKTRFEDYPSSEGYASQDWLEQVLRQAEAADFENLATPGIGSVRLSQTPVFVVGMPRSGTTLVEQIIASHSECTGSGELSTMLNISAMTARALNGDGSTMADWQAVEEDTCEALAARYLASYAVNAEGKLRVVDKNLYNLYLIDFIHRIFPNARFVLCRRNAMDTCWSCYATDFAAGKLRFAHEFEALGWTYRLSRRLIDIWQTKLPSRTLLVDYEEFIGDFEAQARRLIDFIGVEWEDACLSFYETERSVNTASSTQVRQPIYQSSVGRWKPYAHRLGKLQEALGEYAETV